MTMLLHLAHAALADRPADVKLSKSPIGLSEMAFEIMELLLALFFCAWNEHRARV